MEIRYVSSIPRELMLGVALSSLAPIGFVYTPVPASNSSGFNISLGQNQQIAVGIGGNGGGFFTKDKIRIQLVDNLIVFNCVADNYVGWDLYFNEIVAVIEQLSTKQAIKFFNRIGIRYISEFKDVEIFKNLKGSIDVEKTGLNLRNAILRLTDESGNMKTFVTLTNKGKRILPQTQQIIDASLVDINVYENFDLISDINLLKVKLNTLHSKQKDTFFSLISDNFIQTLNPEY
ncbi:MAG: TIGR04255 family protein [Prevotella sp.]|nr:TIGR04255 family protein [Prevotella sp.]